MRPIWAADRRERNVNAKQMRRLALGAVVALGVAGLAAPVGAQDAATEAGLRKFREMLKDPFANPGFLWVDRGEEIWKTAAGPKKVSLETCDLGGGPGKVDGAFAALPRYFADADRVMDLETRLVWCMDKIQGIDPKEATKTKFSPNGAAGDKISTLEALAAFVSNKSNGQKLSPPTAHAKERDAIVLGEALFNRRQGPWDFSCATCHDDAGRRIRLQELPTFSKPAEAQSVMGTWPAYRVSQESLRTMQHRLYDCFWQMRLPQVDYGSDVTIALTAYLASKGAGGVIDVPSVKR